LSQYCSRGRADCLLLQAPPANFLISGKLDFVPSSIWRTCVATPFKKLVT
jgi:hypothetical protein